MSLQTPDRAPDRLRLAAHPAISSWELDHRDSIPCALAVRETQELGTRKASDCVLPSRDVASRQQHDSVPHSSVGRHLVARQLDPGRVSLVGD